MSYNYITFKSINLGHLIVHTGISYIHTVLEL